MNPYAERRARLSAQMQPGAVAIIATAPEVLRNNDCHYPYRHDSYFYYLTGFTEPDSVLVLVAASGASASQAILFCRPKNVEREIWDGVRCGPAGAIAAIGVDAAYPIDELDAEMVRLLASAPAVYYALGTSASLDAQLTTWMQGVRRQARAGVKAPTAAHDVLALLDEMRLCKDQQEQAQMLRAATISAQAHSRAMRSTRPGMREYEIEAELLYEFRKNGAQFPAYTSIVAAGANACVLHYSANDGHCGDGELVLVDAGCEFDGYASDITRTYPVNGRFSAPQQALYEVVLAAQAAALALIRPGLRYSEVHDAAVQVLAQGMLDTGLLDQSKAGGLADVIVDKSYQQFYMHGTGHWIGMDVHDVGAYRETEQDAPGRPWRPLQSGMMLTVEPGIYVRPASGVPEQFWNIGIRIEDDVQVTPDGYTILSSGAPKTVAEIEALMRQ